MRYGDLIQFDPIETIVKLKSADSKKVAEGLVRTYVMSEHMADSLKEIVIPQLQFDQTIDNKGVFIVGTYGTGKSHLMSVLSAIAEDEQMVEFISDDRYLKTVMPIAGKFEVLRFEIGATKMNLRDIVLSNLEKDLSRRGIDYKFPPADAVTDNQQFLLEMMGLFEEVYPHRGYLVFIDELLDYLGGRKELELKFDLNFLREMGEVSKHSRLRFIAGMQETLFDNPNFSFVAKTLLKVKDRFEQIMIHREDVSYVVSHRLLQKNEEQKAWIRGHLERFSFLYRNMGEKMEEYVKLFPIHPAYLETFERVYLAEKREVLKTLTHTFQKMIDKKVPTDKPGLISYDSYWRFVKGHPSFRILEDVKKVIDRSSVLEGIIEHSFTRPQYKPMALRIIHALSVHRLTTGGIHTPIGITIENMKDDLCLFDPLIPEKDDDFLTSQITTVVKEIINTVSGQFIEFNKENEQYYLNPEKSIDVNAKIQQKANVLDDSTLNPSYYNLILKALDFPRAPYKLGFNIWEYELLWENRNVEREGYLFLGDPNDRPTAQPPRDFYIYFIPPYGGYKMPDAYEPDEVFIFFEGSPVEIKEIIKLYAGSLAMAELASNNRTKYLKKAEEYQKKAIDWIQHNAAQCFMIKYRGESRELLSLLKGKRLSNKNLKGQLDLAASQCLNVYFQEKYPDYPRFNTVITRRNQIEHFKGALQYLAGKKTEHGANILDSLGLLDGEVIEPAKSKYAQHLLACLHKLEPGKVVNKDDIIETINDVELDRRFHLENLWITLILAALVYSGDIILAIPGKKYDATMMKELSEEYSNKLQDFKHFERPKDLPIELIKKLFTFLHLPYGMIISAPKKENAVTKMLIQTEKLIDRTIKAQHHLHGDISIWGRNSLQSPIKEEYRQRLRELKEFLDSVKGFDSVAKLKNFHFTEEEIEKHCNSREIIKKIEGIVDFKKTVHGLISYLVSAEMIIDEDDFRNWKDDIQKAKHMLDDMLGNIDTINSESIRKFHYKLRGLQREYIRIYLDLHQKYRLSLEGDGVKKKLLESRSLDNLKKLSTIEDILPLQRLKTLQDQIAGLHTCYSLTQKDMENSFVCPHCHFRPNDKGYPVHGVIEHVEKEVDKLYEDFTAIVISSIEDPMIRDNITYLSDSQQRVLQQVLDSRELPPIVDNNFIKAINTLLKGLEKVEVRLDDLYRALGDGSPITVDALIKRFQKYVETITGEKDADKIRIIIK